MSKPLNKHFGPFFFPGVSPLFVKYFLIISRSVQQARRRSHSVPRRGNNANFITSTYFFSVFSFTCSKQVPDNRKKVHQRDHRVL